MKNLQEVIATLRDALPGYSEGILAQFAEQVMVDTGVFRSDSESLAQTQDWWINDLIEECEIDTADARLAAEECA